MRMLPTNQIWRYWSFETFLEDVSALGVRDVDLWLCNNHVNIDAHGAYNTDEVVRGMRRHGLRAMTLTPEQGNPKAYNVASEDGEIRRLTLCYYRQIVRLAAVLGAERISLNAGWFPFDADRDRAWDAMVSMLGKICRAAAEEGLIVALETLVDKPYRLVTSLGTLGAALLDVREPNLTATIDTGTVARNGEDIDAYLSRFGSELGYVHLTNLNRDIFAHLAWGDQLGGLDPQDLLRRFACAGYTGDAALEMTKPSYFERPRDVLSRALTTLRGCEC